MDSETRRKLLILQQKQLQAKQAAPSGMQARIAAAKAGTLQASPESLARAAQADQIATDTMILDDAGMGRGVVAKAIQGAPFVGEWLDEGVSKLSPEKGQYMRDVQGAMDRQYPKTALAAEIGGGIAGSIPLAVSGVGLAGKAGSTVGKVGRGIGLGLTGGATEGALAGAGRDSEDRMRGAQRGAVIGGGLGAALGAVAPLAADAVSALVKRAKKLDVRVIADEFGISPPAARTVKQALEADDLGEAARRIQQIGDDAMLADAGQGTGALLDAAAQSGGKALRITKAATENRASAAGQRLNAALDDILGPADGVKAAARDISQRTAAARQAAYTRAWQTPIDYQTGGKGEDILSVLKRIPERHITPAIRRANERAQMAGEDGFRQIMASIGQDGSVSFSELPNMRQLHELKVALDDIVREGTDAVTGRRSPDAVDVSNVVSMLREKMKDASPVYAQATRLGGDKIAEDQALDMGKRLLNRATTFEDAAAVLRGASEEAKAAAKRGLREQIETTLTNVRTVMSDSNRDAREAMQLVKDMSSRANEKKVRLVLGADADKLFAELDKAEAALALRAAVAQNSKTGVRQAIQGQVKAEAQPGFIRRTLGNAGNPLDGAREITQTVAGIDPRSMSEAERQVLAEIADALTRIRGDAAEKALRTVQAAMNGQPMKEAQANAIGRIIAGSAAGSAHQSVGQYLEPR